MTDASQSESFLKMVPKSRPVSVSVTCCQNFFLSRDAVRQRPLSVWKSLYEIITLQDVCHKGQPDYSQLFASKHIGPEQPMENGRHTQGNAMEHLAHVVYGHYPLEMPKPTLQSVCDQFYPDCEGSPCNPDELKSFPLLPKS
mmetsp:Transcript_31786/g.43381  ORF Transcript_31786/g.43381 Transcript_31786/m.43381 type:complete len:142 (+) Transcript_31786:557-982(+)